MKLISILSLAFFLAFSASAQLKINEVCYDPSNTGLAGDANGDGVYDQTQDEFIELVNTGTTPLDVSKYRVCDRVIASGLITTRHTVAVGTMLAPGSALVIFGGGTPTGTFGGALVVADRGTAGLSMGNSGERVLLTDSSGVILDSLDTDALSDNPNESYTRNPDVIGAFVQHGTARAGVLFSPGLKVDGTPFANPTSLATDLSSKLQVFPNPASHQVSITLEGQDAFSVQFINAQGQAVKEQWMQHAPLNISDLAAGIYTLRVVGQNTAATRRLVVNP